MPTNTLLCPRPLLLILGLAALGAACDESSSGADPECQREPCTKEGRCTYDADRGTCLAAAGDCASSVNCRRQGNCSAKEGFCRPASGAHCSNSANCAQFGICVYGAGRCRRSPDWQTGSAPCARLISCVSTGQCGGTAPNNCRITDDGCTDSEICKVQGACAKHPDGHPDHCIPMTEAHCRDSDRCADAGRCQLVPPSQKCSVTSDEDCRASWGCRMYGRCTVGIEERRPGVEVAAACVVGSDADCAQAEICLDLGHCTMTGSMDQGTTECAR